MANEKEQATGEIFAGETAPAQPEQQVSAYEQAAEPLSEALEQEAPPAAPDVSQPQEYQVQPPDGYIPPPDVPPATPPPFIESSKKRFIIVGALVLFIILVVIFLFRFLGGGKKGAPTESVTLTYWGLWEDEIVMRPVIEAYKKDHPNVTVAYTKQDPKQYRERLTAAIDRGEGPDIFRYHNSWVPMLAKQLASLPKTVIADADYQSTFYPVVTTDLKTASGFVGIPLEIDGLVLFYNETILKNANVAVPTTWIDVQNAIGTLTVKEGKRIVTSAIALGTAENIEHFSDILSLMMLQNGTNMNKSLLTCADAGTTKCSEEALSFYRTFAEEPNNTWDDTLENSLIAFAGEKVAMVIAPSWQALNIRTMNPNLTFKTAPVPQLPCASQPCPAIHLATYWVEGVSAKSAKQTAAWDFLKFLVSAENLQLLYAEEAKVYSIMGEPYSRVDLGSTLAQHPILAPVIATAPLMKSSYAIGRSFDGETGMNTSLTTYLKDAVNVLGSGGNAQNAIRTADQGFKQVYQRFGLGGTP